MQKDFSYPLKIDELNQQEQHYHLVADESQRKTLQEILQVESVKSFVADISLKLNLKQHLLNVWGVVNAELELKSVVSLENFSKKYSAPFELKYDTKATYKEIREMDADIDDDVPDIIINGQINLADISIEQLALVMEDYPRREGETFDFVPEFDVEEPRMNNPFAALEKLKK